MKSRNKQIVNLIVIAVFATFTTSCNRQKEDHPVIKIAFGSCGNQDRPQPVLKLAADQNPDAFIFLGDNIYGDTDVMDTLRNKYIRWSMRPEYQYLVNKIPIFATWDDHDYGRNDSGKNYPWKRESKEIFMDHFKIAKDNEMMSREGIYHTNYINRGGKKIQLIMLDVRTFRSDVLFYDGKTKLPRDNYFYKPDYMPHTSHDSTLLGSAQWQWLEQELKKPADVRLICSGSQFSIEYNGYEAWANFPDEQQRMLELIKSTKANGLMFLTGDVHYAEISKISQAGLYPIYDITASGITSTWDFATPNNNRIEGPVMDNHYGLLTLDWNKTATARMEIIDVNRNQRIEYTISLDSLKF